MFRLTVNGTTREIDVDPDTPLLWVLREQLALTGAKYGCGIAQCGACTVHIDGVAVRSCSLPVREVKVAADGTLKVLRIVAATDCGHAVNPQQIAAQIEGSFAYGLSAALHGEITLKNGRVEQENFDTYPVIRMDEMPKVESIVMPSGGFWGGVGEPTIFVAAPAVLNALAAATGKRLRHMPVRTADLRRA